MAITFFTQSNQKTAPVWVRIRFKEVDAKARTSLFIENGRLKKSQVIKHRMTSSDDAMQKLLISERNKALNTVEIEMQLLEIRLRSMLTTNTFIDSKWLRIAVMPQHEAVDMNLQDYYASLQESNSGLSVNSLKAYKQAESFLRKYEEHLGFELLVSHIDANFKEKFVKYCRSNGYPESTIKYNLARLKAVCLYAESKGEVVSNQVKNLTKGIKIATTESVFLSFPEIDSIIALDIKDTALNVARDWLVISCFIGQRSVSLLNLTKSDIDTSTLSIKIKQVKTGAYVTIPVLPQVKAILDKHNGNFPPRLSISAGRNYDTYNGLIKDVCKLAGISELTKGIESKRTADKSATVMKPKYELITSHIGRRSFATNFYGKMNLQSIMQITGHTTEQSFLSYVNKGRVIDSDAVRSELLKAMR
jgi:integrase